jgi:hypothetical protein
LQIPTELLVSSLAKLALHTRRAQGTDAYPLSDLYTTYSSPFLGDATDDLMARHQGIGARVVFVVDDVDVGVADPAMGDLDLYL